MSTVKEEQLKLESIASGRTPVKVNGIVSQQALVDVLQDKMQKPCKLILWFNHKVVWGRFIKGSLIFVEGTCADEDFKQLIELRAFNIEEELYLENLGQQSSGYYTQDGSPAGVITEYVDSQGRFWGTAGSKALANNFVQLFDAERKIKTIIPVDKIGSSYYELKVRSYLGYHETTGQASYTHYRFVDIVEGRA